MIVAKFGGTLLNGPDGLQSVRDEILRLPSPLLVVVSAFHDITNRLERLALLSIQDPAGASLECQQLIDDHDIIARSVLDPVGYQAWQLLVASLAERLQEVTEGLGIIRELSPRTLDLIVHVGERLSSSLVAALLSSERSTRILPAVDLIITDAAHRFARPDLKLTRERVAELLVPALNENQLVITEGYIARSTSGEVTTMGRESSNYSAALLGGMLGATAVRIYTAVPGIMTADPELCSDARTIPRMSYAMALSLAELGAKILHPRTVLPVEDASIPLIIAQPGGDCTVIGHDADDAVSIAVLEGVELLAIETTSSGGRVDAFLAAIAASSPIIWHQRFRRRLQIVTALRYPGGELPLALLGEYATALRQQASLVSLVCEVGVDADTVRRFFQAMEGTPALAIQGGIDRGAISVVVPQSATRRLLARLHHEFVTQSVGVV